LGGIIDSDRRNIRADQYGLSSLLVSFLIRNGEERFAKLIDNLKAGLDFREGLIDSYDTTPEQMVQAFGNTLGIANLQP
jgi:hypothetical protein